MLEFLTILVSVSLCSSVTVLSCQRLQLLNESTICPSDPVSCECRGVESLFWVVVSQTADPVFQASVINRTLTMVPTDGFTVVLSNVTVEPLGGQFMRTTLTSKLTVLSMEDVTVECRDNGGPNTVFLQRASSPSSPMNLNFTLTSATTDSVAVRLDWETPQNDGGVAITNYLIFVMNTSQEISSANNTATITLNSTGLHLVQVGAVNECGLSSSNTSEFINITDSNFLSSMTMTTEETSIDNTGDSTTLLTTTFSTITTVVSGGGPNQSAIGIGAGVGGAVIATIIIAIIIAILVVVGTFIRRGNSGGTKVNGDTEMMDGYAHFGFNTPNNGASGGPVVDPRIEDEYSVLARQNGPNRKTRGAQLVPQSEYSVLEQKNGAEPEMIQDYAYCRIGAEPKQPKKTLQYIEVETSTERVNRQKEMLAPACNDVQYSAVKVKTHPEDDLLNLNNLLLQLRPVQSSWAQIAKSLNITEDRIQHIRGTTSGEDYDCLVEVCDEWLECHRKQDMNPTWRAVSNALNRAGCKDLAKEIKDIYKTGKLPRSPSDDEVTAASASGDAPNSSYDDVIVTSPQKKPAMKPPAELPQYDDVIVTSPQKKPAMKPPAELPQYDDVITSSDAPPPIPPQRFEVQ